MSEQTAVLLEKYFPRDKPKLALAKFFRCLAKAHKIFTSRVRKDPKDDLKSALGTYYKKQNAVLDELEEHMQTIEFKNLVPNEGAGGSKIRFQDGIITTCRGIRGLQTYVREKHNLPYLMCSHVDQNYQESLHGQLKNGKSGGVIRPSALAFNYRIAR